MNSFIWERHSLISFNSSLIINISWLGSAIMPNLMILHQDITLFEISNLQMFGRWGKPPQSYQ